MRALDVNIDHWSAKTYSSIEFTDKGSVLYKSASGMEVWRNKRGELHREDGPAILYADKSERWYLNGDRHRDGGPSVIYSDGSMLWFKNNQPYTPTAHEVITYKLKIINDNDK